MPTLGLTYVVREDLIEGNADTVGRFLKATMKGLEFASSNTEETIDIVLKYAENADRDHMRFMLAAEIEDATSPETEANGLGWMTAGQWQVFHDSLLRYDALPGPIGVEEAFTNRFLKGIYRNGQLQWP